MRRLASPLLVALAVPALAQAPQIQKERAPGAEVRFVATPWRPDVFATLESGGTVPEGQRAWAFAFLDLSGYFTLGGRPLSPGHYALVLNPKLGSLPLTLELRRVDGRATFAGGVSMAPPPGGESVYKAPAVFERSPEPVPALDVTLTGWPGGLVLDLRYGDRRLTKELLRATP